MAKISTYPADATPSLSDMVIGTDVNDANNTKNYSISSILGLANLTTTYVPYTGANNDVDLGNNNLSLSGNLLFPNSTSGIYFVGGTSFITGLIDFYSLNAQVSNYNVINKIDFIQPWTELQMQGNPGSAGQFLVSQGSGSSPIWSNDAGANTISAASYSVNGVSGFGITFTTSNAPISLFGYGDGSQGQVMTSSGTGSTPAWAGVTFYQSKAEFLGFNSGPSPITADTPYAMYFNSTTISQNILALTNGANNSRITFQKAGDYKINYSLSINVAAGGNNQTVTMWLRKNGTGSSQIGNIANTSVRFHTGGSGTVGFLSSERVVTVNANDYIEIMVSQSVGSPSITPLYVPALLVPPFAPAQPSVMAIITEI